MYTASLRPIEYHDPWALDFDTRFRTLLAGSPKILKFYAGVQLQTYVTSKQYATHSCASSISASPPPI